MGSVSGSIFTKSQSIVFNILLIPFLLFFALSPAAVEGASEEYSVHIGPYGYAPYFIVHRSRTELNDLPSYSGIAHDLLTLFEKQYPQYERTHVLLTRKRANTLMVKGAVVDLMFNSPLFVAPDILKHYEFSNTLITSKDVVVTRREKNFTYTSPADMYGMSVGAIRGYSYGEFDRLFSQGSIEDIRVDDHQQAIGMLAKNRVDAYLGNIYVSPYYMKTMGLDRDDFVFSTEVMYEIDFAFLVNKNKPKLLEHLNEFIDRVSSDGSLDAVADRYLN